MESILKVYIWIMTLIKILLYLNKIYLNILFISYPYRLHGFAFNYIKR